MSVNPGDILRVTYFERNSQTAGKKRIVKTRVYYEDKEWSMLKMSVGLVKTTFDHYNSEIVSVLNKTTGEYFQMLDPVYVMAQMQYPDGENSIVVKNK